MATLLTAEPGEARGGTQFPEVCPLLRCDAQGLAIQFLSGGGITLPQQQFAFLPVQFRCQPALARSSDDL
jgi:hypothetical protein